jgi:prophage antirepressor-like protein
MNEEIIEDNNCIVKAFENNPISILTEEIDNKKIYCFKASDIGKALNIVNIRTSIMNFDGDEVVVRTTYDTIKRNQEILFLTSQGVYRLLYNSKKEIAKKFRKWAGNILDDIIFNESAELKRQLEEKETLLEESSKLLLQQKEQIEQFENKPDLEGFSRKSGYIYIIEDTTKPGHKKIGSCNFDRIDLRVIQMNVASSTYSLKRIIKFETFDVKLVEEMIHSALQFFKIKGRKEWFYIKNEFELAYTINIIKKCIEFSKQFDVKDYNNLKELNKELNISNELLDIKKEIKKNNDKIKENAQQMKNKTGNYKGIYWKEDKKKWTANLKKDYNNIFLGYYETELDGAKAYNDYATFLNQNENTHYSLNEIEDYINIPRDIPNEKQEKEKSSNYIGVSYWKQRKYFVVSIKLNSKTYNLGHNDNEIECAKLYNQQALYFNETLASTYELNIIPDYITISKNIIKEIQNSKQLNKTSKYIGVSFNKQTKKYKATVVYNKKQIHIGFFENELDAAKAYNTKAEELNKEFNKKYNLNRF